MAYRGSWDDKHPARRVGMEQAQAPAMQLLQPDRYINPCFHI